MYMLTTRACTHFGTCSCTLVLKLVMVMSQAVPVSSNITGNSQYSLGTRARARLVPTNTADPSSTRWFKLKRCPMRPMSKAPDTAPAPSHDSITA